MRTIAFLATACLHSQIPDGSYHFEDHMDDCGLGTEPIKVAVTVTVEGGHMAIDFDGTDSRNRA